MIKLSFLTFVTVGMMFAQSGNPAVTTGQYNIGRTAANLDETILNTANVDSTQFGKLFSWPVDGWIFGQPLYMPGVQIGGKAMNMVYVATMHNSVYAFDTDNPAAAPVWKTNFGASVAAPSGNGCPASDFTGPELGILSTPAIDPKTNLLYVVSAAPSGGGFVHYLHALDITTGKEQPGSPLQIKASVRGDGYDAVNGAVTLSTSSTDVQRTALLLANGSVYAAFGNCGPDNDPWHGWIVGYSTTNLKNQTLVFNSTPNGGQGGIWQSGRGPAADSSGNLYFTTGNATGGRVSTGSDTSDAAQGDYPMRLLQLSSSGKLLGSYPPANYAALNANDLDFSSSGPLVIPGRSLLLAGGKDGVMNVFSSTDLSTPQQSFQATGTAPCAYSFNGCQQIHDLAFWNDTLYVWGSNDVLRAYDFGGNTFGTRPASQNTIQTGYHPASLAVSANASNESTGVLWALTPDAVFHAFEASKVANELWNSSQNGTRDALPSAPRFTEPTIANGRAYVATQSDQVVVYGLLGDFSLLPSVSSQTIYGGSSASFTVTVKALAGSTAPVTLSMDGLPRWATATFNPSTIAGSGSSRVTIWTSRWTPSGRFSLTIVGAGHVLTRSANVSLTVTGTCGYSTDPAASGLPYSGGSDSIAVSTASGCR